MFHWRHKWEVVNRTILPSPFEQIEKSCANMKSSNPDERLFEKDVIFELKCSVCGTTKIERL